MEDADARGSAPVLSLSQNINHSETNDNRYLNFDAIISGRIINSDVASLNISLPDFELSRPEAVFAVKGKGNAANKFKKRLGAKKVKAFERNAVGSDGTLRSSAATTFRAVSAIGNYLAQDRPDGTYSSKELCREFACPNDLSLQNLKRLGRYYVGRPRLVYQYPFSTKPTDARDVYVDTDFAGCTQTRRSTSGGCALVKGYLVKHWSKTQPTIALSSGEAELVGIGQGMAQALGLQSLAQDMN